MLWFTREVEPLFCSDTLIQPSDPVKTEVSASAPKKDSHKRSQTHAPSSSSHDRKAESKAEIKYHVPAIEQSAKPVATASVSKAVEVDRSATKPPAIQVSGAKRTTGSVASKRGPCVFCGEDTGSAKFCGQCGQDTSLPLCFCPSCDGRVQATPFCPSCGHAIGLGNRALPLHVGLHTFPSVLV